jgi:tRNA dimethylallyltransferase
MNAHKRPILCLAGPTASGKSALGLAYARSRAQQGSPVEIISVDSATIYRGMNVGTAKPSLEELAQVPHHLIDIRDPHQSYSAGEFCRDAEQLIQSIQARGSEPLLVGGTMLYFQALLQGIDELPPANAAVRAELDAKAQVVGWPAMHQLLATVDPVAAAKLSPNDSQRIQRALEVFRTTGQPLSAYFNQTKPSTAQPHLTPRFQLVALEPGDRSWLHARIERRFDAMLKPSGGPSLIDEVKALQANPRLSATLPAMRCVGYRQVWEYLDRPNPHLDAAKALTEMRERGVAASRQLAKRQLTWLRGWPGKISLPAEASTADNLTQLLRLTTGSESCSESSAIRK